MTHRLRPWQSLPDDLLIEILLRLPVRSLLQLKCVCKSWKTLISDSQFAKRHLQSLTMDPSITNPQFFFGRGDGEIVSIPVKPLLENPSELTKAVEFDMKQRRLRVIGSCNGLVCLLEVDQGYVRLWNPSTRFKSNKSPSLNLLFNKWTVASYGFGYDHVNDKYKVLLDVRYPLANDGYNSENVRLYTFGENSWSTIQNFPCPPTRFTGKLVSGTLNWVLVRQDAGYRRITILSFDLVKETYTEIPVPQNQKHDDCRPKIGVWHNCLCLCFETPTHLAVWLMKEHGVAESWTRLEMIPEKHLQKHVKEGPYCVIEALFIFENTIVLLRTISAFLLYDLNNGRIDIPLISTCIRSNQFLYVESLISPQL